MISGIWLVWTSKGISGLGESSVPALASEAWDGAFWVVDIHNVFVGWMHIWLGGLDGTPFGAA